MLDLGPYRDRFSADAAKVLERAVAESERRRHFYLGSEHLLWAAVRLTGDLIAGPLRELGADPRRFIHRLDEALGDAAAPRARDQQVPDETRGYIRAAWEEAGRAGRAKIETVDLLEAILRAEDSVPSRVLRSMGVDPGLLALRARIHAREQAAPKPAESRSYELPAALAQLGVSMNKQALEGRYAPLVGRDVELAQMIEILCHRERANSVIVTGEPGVGKSALVEGFVQRIVFEPDGLPARLRKRHVVNLQMNTVVAGTAFRGMFEERMEKILQEVREHPEIMLFVDEVHTLVGAGSAMGVPADAANILKQALARGQIQIIGATTQTEYKQSIAEDGALARRFRLVHLEEPTTEEAARILDGYLPRLEEHYGVHIAPAALETALELSPRYQRWAHLPDKAIAWLDTASVKAEIAGRRDVGADDVVAVVAQEARIPEDMIRRRVNDRFADVEPALGRRVVGQHHAIEAVARHLRLSKGPLKRNHLRPDAVFLFLGPTGVGKTELAKATSEFLFGDDERMVRIDMSEYQAGGLSVDKLIGMPRGIVGSERGGILTSRLRDQPYSVVLLDEIEKASTEVRNLFLQGFDEGWITDGRGRRTYLSDAVIIMTSNLGSDQFKKFLQPLGFRGGDEGALDGARAMVVKELERAFSPEFLNRIDEIVVFDPLSAAEVEEITRRILDRLAADLRRHCKSLVVGEGVAAHLAETGFSLKYGARFLLRSIDERVKVPITLAWDKRRRFRLAVEDGALRVL